VSCDGPLTMHGFLWAFEVLKGGDVGEPVPPAANLVQMTAIRLSGNERSGSAALRDVTALEALSDPQAVLNVVVKGVIQQ